jgi:hypothetical protein
MARVSVDAFPGENFMGRIARVSPVLDPSTRTAPIEVEITNEQYRLKPGMYARVGIITESHPNALVVPTNALVDANGSRGVYLAVNNVAQFHPVKIGIEGNDRTEVLDGLDEGDHVVTTGAAGLRNGDPIILAGAGLSRGRGQGSVGSGGLESSDGPTDASTFRGRQRGGTVAPAPGTAPETGGRGRRGGGQRPGGAQQARPETN